MFNDFSDYWKSYGFEILLIISVFLLLLLWLAHKGKKGTWSPLDSFTLKRNNLNFVDQNKQKRGDSRGELECRRVLEKLFNKSFEKIRPEMLKNPIGNSNLELDCYNDEMKLAVEYNGIQHYKFTPYFHKTKDTFQNQQYRDYIKRQLCEKNGIHLIEVPYTIKIEEIEGYLRKALNLD